MGKRNGVATRRGIGTTLVLLMLAACTSVVVGPDDEGFEFDANLVSPGEAPIPDFEASGGRGVVEVRGAIETPHPCHHVDGLVVAHGRRLSFEVMASPRDVDACIQVVAAFAYRGRLTGIAAGSYPVEIVHRSDAGSDVVFEAVVEVE